MANQKLSALAISSPRGTPDRANDIIYVEKAGVSYGSTVNNELGISGNPVGDTDSQTLTNKTLTSPAISGPTLSGTLTGTYTLGGTPTFPASVVTLTGSQTLTNKVLTSPTISSPTITNASITADAITGFTSANNGTIYGMAITNSAIPNSALPSGTVVQIQATNFTAVATGTTVIPHDNTIPQNTEGDQYMTQAIAPKSASNRLFIEAKLMLGFSANGQRQAALFQDSTANALAAQSQYAGNFSDPLTIYITHDMVAGTTSSTTFKVRAGADGAGTTTFNGATGAGLFGGITLSSMKITEYKP